MFTDLNMSSNFSLVYFRQIKLVVVKPDVRILGDSDIHVKEGSQVKAERKKELLLLLPSS